MITKKLLALLLAISIILTAGPFDIFIDIFAGLSPYDPDHGIGTYSEPADYRKIHPEIFDPKGADAPTAKFSVVNKADNKVIGTSSDDNSPTIIENIPVGTVIKIANLSTKGSGAAIDMIDFQVTKDGSQICSTQTAPAFLNSYELTLDSTGTYKFYLCVRDNTDRLKTDKWSNWSYNGAHVATGLNLGFNDKKETTGTPETAGGDDFWGLWYFAQVVVKVTKNPPKPDFTISYKGINVTDNKSNPATIDPSNKSLVLQDISQPFSTAEPITGRKWYYWDVSIGWTVIPGSDNKTTVNIADMDITLAGSGANKSFKLVCTSNTGAEAYKEHIAYFVPAPPPPPPPPPGLADILVYYKDKATDIDISAPDLTTYKGKSYGTYSIPAAVVSGYTLDSSTPSPRSVTVDAVNNSVKVTFLYNSQGGGTPGNKPPVAVITGANTIFAGEEVTLSGTGSYDPDGEIVAYTWDIGTGTLVYNNGSRMRLWYEEPGNKTPELTVTDDDGATDWAEHNIRVKEPVPTVNLVVSGKLKENRKVTLDASDTYSPKHYPINYYNWTINNSADLKLLAPLNTTMKHDVLFKTARSYTPVITVKNTYGLSGSDTETIAIAPDQNPKANFSAVVKLLRNPADSAKNATITATNLSSSPDSDPIKATVMFYAYDSDNDGSFDDETWYYSLNGTTWLAAGLTYTQLKTGSFDIYTRGTSNPATFTVKTNQVGKYKFEAMTIENIPAADTIPSLITAADYRRNSTFTGKPDSEKIIEVINTAPTITFEAKKKKEVDILIATDYTDQKLADLQAALNVQKATLLAKNIDVKYTIVNTTSPVAHVNDSKFWYRRYGRYKYHADRESWSSGGGGNDKYDEPFEETVLWEEQQALESEVGYLPPRIPRNVTWSKSGIIFEEDEDGTKNWEREYFNVTIRAQNDFKSQDIIKKTTYYRGGMASDTSYGYEFSNIHSESGSLDSSFVKEEKIADVTVNVNSVDFAPITSAVLRASSDRYLLFIGDSNSKIYSGEWGTHFPFGGLTKTEQDYIKANGIKPYIVAPQSTLDTIVGLEKAKETYPGNLLLFKAWDDSYMTILEGYPANVSLESGINEVYGDYVLLTNGTLKYRAGGASYGTLVSNVTKCLPVKNAVGDIEYNGNLWVVTSDGKLRQYKNGVPGFVFSFSDATDVFDGNLSNESYGTNIISTASGTYFMYANGTTKLMAASASKGYIYGQVRDEYGDYWGYGLILVHTDGKTTGARYVESSRWNSAKGQYEDYLSDVKSSAMYQGIYNEATETYSFSAYPLIKPASVYEWIISDKLHFPGSNTGYTGLNINFYGNGYERYFLDSPSYNQNAILNVADVKDGVIRHTDGRISAPITNTKTLIAEIPELQGKTIKKAIADKGVNLILTTDGALYMRNGTVPSGTPWKCSIPLIANNVEDIYRNTFNANVNWSTIEQNYYYYFDITTKQIKNALTNAVVYNDVIDVKISDINQNIYVVTGNGKLYGQGYFGEKYGSQQTPIGTLFHELIKTRLVINDPAKPYITLRSILENIPDTKYFTAGQYAAAVQDITNIYLNDTSFTTNYILVNDEVSYTKAYSDYENDSKFAEEWKFLHEPYWFDNSMGLAPFHGQTLASSVIKYTKKGRYTINLRARDNPKNDVRFKNDTNEAYNYYKWSTGNQNVLLYVHEKPIALARAAITKNSNDTYTVKAMDAGSNDPDHSNSRADKGIAAREWRWKEAASTVWTAGQMNKTDCTADESYVIQLRVKDIEGVWSDYYTIAIDKDNPPVALFSLVKTLININDPLKAREQSFPQSFSTITNWHWVVKKLNTDGTAPGTNLQSAIFTTSNAGTEALAGFDSNVKTNYAANGVGSYRVYLRVKDSNGLWSDGGTNSTIPADLSKYYSMDFNVDKAPTASFTVEKSVIRIDELLKVKDTSTTAGISGIARWHWVVKKLNADGTIPTTYIQNEIHTNSNTGTDALSGYDCNVNHDYREYGAGKYRIYLRACNGNGMWSDGGTDAAFNPGGFFYRDVVADAPPTASFAIETNPIEPSEALKLKDTSVAVGVSPLDRWNWIIKKLNPDGSEPAGDLLNSEYPTHNAGTGILKGYESNIITDYSELGPGTYRIYLRVRNANGMWSDGFFQRDLIVRESFKISNFRVVKVKDLHLEDFYYNPATGLYDDRPMDVNSMAVDHNNFSGMVEGLAKGYSFEFEIDTVNFNGSGDEIIINPHFYTCDSSGRDAEERELYWENSDHEILKAGQGGHAAWAEIRLGRESRIIKNGNKATWRGSYLIPGTAWAVPKHTTKENAVFRKLKKDVIVSFEIKGYKDGAMKFDYNLRQWPLERDHIKWHYEIGDVIRYDHTKCNLDDNKVILNRP